MRVRWDGAVPKHDAFGREIGDDTLAGLGGGDRASEPRSAEAPVAHVAAPERDQAVAPEPAVRPRRRRGLGCLVGLVVLVALAAVPIVALVGVIDSATDTFDEITDAIEPPADVEPVVPEPPAQPPRGISGASMIARANFGPALRRMDGLGRAAFIRLSPDRVDAQLVKGARRRDAEVGFEGELSRGPATRGGSGSSTVALSAIDRSAPARLVRASAARFGLRERSIDYLVLSPYPGESHRWTAYFRNGVYVQGDRSGKVLRRIS